MPRNFQVHELLGVIAHFLEEAQAQTLELQIVRLLAPILLLKHMFYMKVLMDCKIYKQLQGIIESGMSVRMRVTRTPERPCVERLPIL